MNNYSPAQWAVALCEAVKEGTSEVSAITAIAKTILALRDKLLLRKLTSFIGVTEGLSAAQRSTALHDITVEMKDKKIGELLLTYLDRTEDEETARMIGRAFYALGTDRITANEFWRMAYALSVLPSFALRSLYRNEHGAIYGDHMTLFGAAGIAWFVDNIGSGSFFSFANRESEILISLRDDIPVKRYE